MPRSPTDPCPGSRSVTSTGSPSRPLPVSRSSTRRGRRSITTIPLAGGGHGLALVPDLDDTPRLYVTSGGPTSPGYDVIAVGGDAAKGGPVSQSHNPLPGPGSWVTYDAASQIVHIMGLRPNVDSRRRPATRTSRTPGRSTSSSPSVARMRSSPMPSCRRGSSRAPGPPTSSRTTRRPTASSSSSSTAPAPSASIDMGSHAFAWRLPGVIAGAITAALLYLLARILFRRRLVAGLGRALRPDRRHVLRPGPDRDERRLRRACSSSPPTRSSPRSGPAGGGAAPRSGSAIPIVGVLLGLALASKWVAAYAIGALAPPAPDPERPRPGPGDPRSDRDHQRARLHGHHGARGTGVREPDVPPDHGRADPGGRGRGGAPPGRLDRRRVPVRGPRPGRPRHPPLLPGAGPRDARPGRRGGHPVDDPVAPGDRPRGGLTRSSTCSSRRRRGSASGRSPRHRPRTTRSACSTHPARRPTAGSGPGTLLGIPIVWALASLVAVPLVVYVISYIPWAMVEGHQLFPGWPPGHTGQTLLGPDPGDVRLPQQPQRGPPGVVAVVGLADEPQARLVLPGVAGQRDRGVDL